MKKYVIANWKMHGSRHALKNYLSILNGYSWSNDVEAVVCPPLAFISEAVAQAGKVAIGVQNCSSHVEEGAFTGEVRAEMIQEVGARFVIVGHSERRAYHQENDSIVAQKAAAAHAAGLKAIVCVGESLEQRQAGETLQVLKRQIPASLPPSAKADNTIIAYEPIWAIGTGQAATPADVAQAHQAIKELYPDFSVVYGGSVNAQNAKDLLSLPAVDGALVGKASLNAEDFGKIIQSS